MARPLRIQVANGVYHVTARGNERRPIYAGAADRERFLEILAATLERFAWCCQSPDLSLHESRSVASLEQVPIAPATSVEPLGVDAVQVRAWSVEEAIDYITAGARRLLG